MPTHLAIYGNRGLVRHYCNSCQAWALVISGRKQCCDKLVSVGKVTQIQRMTSPEARRRVPSLSQRERLLDAHNYRCAYCFQAFGSYVHVKGDLRKLLVRWDHRLPYAFDQDNDLGNFLPACQLCNGWKADHIFQTLDETRVYLTAKWEAAR